MHDVTCRPMRPSDIGAVVEVANLSRARDAIEQVLDPTEFAELLEAHGADLERDARVLVAAGTIVGWVHTLHQESATDEPRCWVFGEVDPDWRGRGHGGRLLDWGVARARQQLRDAGRAKHGFVCADAYAQQSDRDALLRSRGLRPARWFEELLRPLADLPRVPVVPGVSILPWPPDRDEEILRVRDEAFADHWGTAAMTAEVWRNTCRGFGARPDLSLVAVEAERGRVVSFCLNHRYPADDPVTGRRDGSIDTLGTLRSWRGRGIATALLATSLDRFAAAGLTHATIEVDSDSPTGAGRLYRSLGFAPVHRSAVYQLPARGAGRGA